MKNLIRILGLFLLVVVFNQCTKNTDFQLDGPLPDKPEFTIDSVPGDPNSFVVTDVSQGNFTRSWVFEEGTPATSILQSDTVVFRKKGTFDISLHISAIDGNGTAFNTKQIEIQQDIAGCPFKFLNEDCSQKCWRLSGEPGGVLVGPIPYSGEWYTSPNIVDTQADDKWCFDEDGVFIYDNNGSSFSSCQGNIEVEDYPIPSELTWNYEEGNGEEGLNRIIINDIWMGIEDTGPTYDVVSVSENEMVILTPIKPCDGAASPGWFTLTFFRVE